MAMITAEQAAEAAKGLNFELVWTALMETRHRQEEAQKQFERAQRQFDERFERSQRQFDEQFERTQKRTEEQFEKTQKQFEKTQKHIDELSRNVGGVNNALGRFTESLFASGLDELFNEFGYPFTKQGPHVKFKVEGKVVAESDYFLENGDYAMGVEVKTELKIADVDEHVRRIGVIRQYFDARNDKRILVGAVAGGIVPENVLNYAQKQGLYVVTQKGDSAVVADLPQNFKVREWV